MTIEYDTPIQVTEEQYKILVRDFPGIIAHRRRGNTYWIKVWIMKYKYNIQQIIAPMTGY